MCDVDWEAIKTDYVANRMSYREVGAKYGIDPSHVCRRGKAEGWANMRATLANKTATLVVDAVAEQRCASLLALTRASDNLANALERLSQQLVDEDGKADAKSIEAFARTVNLNAEALRNLYGIPTQAQKHSQQLAEERLEMERKRLEMEIRESEKEHNAEPVRFVIVRPDEVSGNA